MASLPNCLAAMSWRLEWLKGAQYHLEGVAQLGEAHVHVGFSFGH